MSQICDWTQMQTLEEQVGKYVEILSRWRVCFCGREQNQFEDITLLCPHLKARQLYLYSTFQQQVNRKCFTENIKEQQQHIHTQAGISHTLDRNIRHGPRC